MGGVRAGAAIWALTAVLCISGCGAGFCVKPSSTLPYCNFISYKIYVVTPTVDLAYFLALDSKAELLADAMKANEDCDNSIQLGASFCKNYACALTLPRCNAADDRPLPVCRDTCKDCMRTCAPDRPILPPSIFYSDDADGMTWANHYFEVEYDALTKEYKCDANHRLADGYNWAGFRWGPACTSPASRGALWSSGAVLVTIASAALALLRA
mmetsp:Transcript_10583/g.25766  ORF Transcript_10583/g.25766 Transcript_10583/m.25766 type:complete len:212 (-) Transcript_10583:257-892(-)